MHNGIRNGRHACVAVALSLAIFCGKAAVAADDIPLLTVATDSPSSGAGLGLGLRFENSPYRGGWTRNDFVPIYVYEGKRAFLETDRLGLKLKDTPEARIDLFLGYRFEGHPYDRIPASLSSMANRGPAIDLDLGLGLGLGYQYRKPWGTLFGELLRDAVGGSNGTEARLGYRYDWALGKLRLQPQISLALRDANLNNFYYGVRQSEATATRPAYEPGSGANLELGLSAVYRLSERWRLLAGVAAKRWSSGVCSSPIVEERTQLAGQFGLACDFSSDHDA